MTGEGNTRAATTRINELLEANNRYLERARKAEERARVAEAFIAIRNDQANLAMTDERIIDLAVAHSNYKETSANGTEFEVISHRRIVEFSRELIAILTIAIGRDAFKAGWRTNATNDQPPRYLDCCEEADWIEYQQSGLELYLEITARAAEAAAEENGA